METLNDPSKTVSLYKVRDIGATLNDTISYLRTNFSNLILPLVLVVWPLKVVFTFIFKTKIQSTVTPNDPTNVFSNLSTIFLFSFAIAIVAQMANTIIVVYMRLNDEQKRIPAFGEVMSDFLKKIPKVFITGLIVGFMMIVGFILLIIPGIYLIVVFSIILPVIVVENSGSFDSISRCFRLMKDRFWATAGLMIVMFIIMAVLNILGQIPTWIVTFSGGISGFRTHYYNPDPYSARFLIPLLIEQLVNTFTYAIYIVAITLWYYSLVEEKEGINAAILLDKIKDKPVTGNEGDF